MHFGQSQATSRFDTVRTDLMWHCTQTKYCPFIESILGMRRFSQWSQQNHHTHTYDTQDFTHHPAATVAVINHYVAGFRLQNNLLILSTPQKYNDLYSIECVFNCNTHKSYQVSILISERNFLICFAISFLNIY